MSMVTTSYYRVRAAGLLAELNVASVETLARVLGLSVEEVQAAAEMFAAGEVADMATLECRAAPAVDDSQPLQSTEVGNGK